MADEITVLFTSAGRRNQLIDCFRRDAEELGLRLRVLAADLRPELSSACHAADAAFAVPRCTSEEYVPQLLEIARAEGVKLVVPTIDPELGPLSRQQAQFAKLGTRVVVSEPGVVALAGDKQATAERLAAAGVTTPATCALVEYMAAPDRLRWPVVVKPRSGSASVGIVRPMTREELDGLDAAADSIVQELWRGTEYTVNMFFDASGTLRCAVPHRRIEVRAGEVSKGRTERIPRLLEAAELIASAISGAARGPLCFQAIVDDTGACGVFEINARFGGGYPLAHRAGARFSRWLLQEATGVLSDASTDWRTGVTMLRYDAAVFIDE
ncbi:MAG: ATP-grasp domain-containing protein [Opitutae bacterium]|nr:ATP-grasp domain-containing protein [Opitutae bacterium]